MVAEQEWKDWDVRLYLGLDQDNALWFKHHESFEHPVCLTIDCGFYEVPDHKVPFNDMMKHAYDESAEYMVLINDVMNIPSRAAFHHPINLAPLVCISTTPSNNPNTIHVDVKDSLASIRETHVAGAAPTSQMAGGVVLQSRSGHFGVV